MTPSLPTGDRSAHYRATLARARRRRPRRAAPPTLGGRLADLVATRVGSWRFVLGQSAILALWITGNALAGSAAWDPYPFILLNLMLSFQAAYTAPIIMMSQNRQSIVDRERAVADYRVNLRAEAEIALLHEKLDLLRAQEILALTTMLQRTLDRIDVLEARNAGLPEADRVP